MDKPEPKLLDCDAVLARLEAAEEADRQVRADRGVDVLPKINLTDPWGNDR